MMNSSDQESFWDSVASHKEFPVPFNIDLFGKYVMKDMMVLDYGCGYGRVLNELHESGFVNLVGVDFSQGMIDRGRQLYPDLSLSKCPSGAIPFPDGSFHAVILVAVLTCIPQSEDQRALMAEARRVLKDGGILYLHDCLLNSDERNIERYREYSDRYGEYGVFELPEGAVVRHHSREHIEHTTVGWERVLYEECVHTTMNGHSTRGFCYVGRKILAG